jgi:chromate reductase
VNVFAISGSLQRRSTNTDLLRVAALVAPEGSEVIRFAALGDVPGFNPDLEEGPVPWAVAELRKGLAAADAVLIATPEYAHGMPGVLKNALDWVVGSAELYGKPVAVLCASPRPDGGARAREWLTQTLAAQGAVTVSSSTVQVRRPTDQEGLTDASVTAAVTSVVRKLLDAANAGSA